MFSTELLQVMSPLNITRLLIYSSSIRQILNYIELLAVNFNKSIFWMNEVRSSVLIINNVTHSHALTLILLKQGRIYWKPASYEGRSRSAARKANVGQRRSGAKQRCGPRHKGSSGRSPLNEPWVWPSLSEGASGGAAFKAPAKGGVVDRGRSHLILGQEFEKHLSSVNLKSENSRSPMNLKHDKNKNHLKIYN